MHVAAMSIKMKRGLACSFLLLCRNTVLFSSFGVCFRDYLEKQESSIKALKDYSEVSDCRDRTCCFSMPTMAIGKYPYKPDVVPACIRFSM